MEKSTMIFGVSKHFFYIFLCLSSFSLRCQADVIVDKRLDKTGVVSLNSILEVLPAYLNWKKEIEKKRENFLVDLQKRKSALEKTWKMLEKEYQKLEGLRGALGEAKYNEKKRVFDLEQQRIQESGSKLEESHGEMQQKLYVAEQSVAKRLDQEMQRIMEELCAKQGVSIVLNGAGVLYINRLALNISVVDLTPDAARAMEAKVTSLQEYVPELSEKTDTGRIMESKGKGKS